MTSPWTPTLELAVVREYLNTVHGDHVGLAVVAIMQKYLNSNTQDVEWREIKEFTPE